MNKKAIVGIIALVVAVIISGIFWWNSHKDTPTSTSTPTSTPTPTSSESQESTDNQFTISTFTAEVEYYKTTKGIAKEDKIPEESLEDLYSHLKHIAKIDPNIVENEENEYFPGYLEWYNTTDTVSGLGTVEPVEVPKDTTEVKKNANGGVDVPKDQVLAYIADTYGKEALDITQEAINYGVKTLDGVQSALSIRTPETMEKLIDAWASSVEDKKAAIRDQQLSDAHDGAAEVQAYASGQK